MNSNIYCWGLSAAVAEWTHKRWLQRSANAFESGPECVCRCYNGPMTMDAIWHGFEAFIDLGKSPKWPCLQYLSIGRLRRRRGRVQQFRIRNQHLLSLALPWRDVCHILATVCDSIYMLCTGARLSAYRQPTAGCSNSYFQQCRTKFSK